MSHSKGSENERCLIKRAREGRRERHRRELLADIASTARELIVAEGTEAVTMAAVAGRLGVTPPALYRYVAGRSGLIDLACLQISEDLADHLLAVRRETGGDALDELLAGCRGLRSWALEHRPEFIALFTQSVDRPDRAPELAEQVAVAVRAFAWTLEEPAIRVWRDRLDRAPADDELPAPLRESFTTYHRRLLADAAESGLAVEALPISVAAIIMQNWTRLFGQICMEVFGQIGYAVPDGEPMFEWTLYELCRAFDVEYRPAVGR